MISQGELALAQIGVSSVINKEPPKMGVIRTENALAIPDKIAGLAKKAIKGELSYYPDKRKHSYKELVERMSVPMSRDEVNDMISLFPLDAHGMASEFAIVIQHTMEALRNLIPVSTISSFTGPRNILPSDDRLWKFFNQLELLNDPLKIFNMISAGALLKSQAEAVKSIYPTLSDEFTKQLYKAVADCIAEKQSFRLAPRVEYGFGNWLGRRTVEYSPPMKDEIAPRKTQTPVETELKTETQKAISA